MGNKSNLDQWATMERMRFIERSAYWRGIVNRHDLARVFGLSMAQASADLQEYQRLNPGALHYNLNRKRYEGAETMSPVVTEAIIEEAMAMFLTGGGELSFAGAMTGRGSRTEPAGAQVLFVRMPVRRAARHVERKVFLAVFSGLRIHVKYYSVNSGRDDWRWLHPRCFAHDGNRWHVRAWCERRNAWADFTLSRMADANWPEEAKGELPPDGRSSTKSTIRLRPHQSLSEEKRKAVELDYGMAGGELELTVPEVIADYLRARLGVPLADGTTPPPLLEVKMNE